MEEKRKFGGKTSGTWDAKWHSKTKAVRVPIAIADQLVEIAKIVDAGNADIADVLELLKPVQQSEQKSA